MKSAAKHTGKRAKGERLGWTSPKGKTEVRLTPDLVQSRAVTVATTPDTGSNRNLLVP